VIFPGVLEAERRVDYLYLTIARLDAMGRRGLDREAAPKELQAFAKLASEGAGLASTRAARRRSQLAGRAPR